MTQCARCAAAYPYFAQLLEVFEDQQWRTDDVERRFVRVYLATIPEQSRPSEDAAWDLWLRCSRIVWPKGTRQTDADRWAQGMHRLSS